MYLAAVAAVTVVAYVTGWTDIDLSGWFATWGRDALHFGPASLYEAPWSSDNPPTNPNPIVLPAIVEALIGTHDPHLDPFLFKILPLLALFALPIVTAAALDAVGRAGDARITRTIVLGTVANPAFAYSTAIWAQSDIIVSLVMVAAFIGFARGYPARGTALYIAGIVTKPQPILALPVFAVLALASRPYWKVAAAAAFVACALLPATYPHGGFLGGYAWLVHKFTTAASEYPYATIGAGTLPGILTGDGFIDDRRPVFGIPVHQIAMASVAVTMLAIAIAAWRERGALRSSRGIWYIAVSCMAVYWLAPHMHERYITYAAVFAVLWAFAARTHLAAGAAAMLSIALLLQMITNWPLDLGWGMSITDASLRLLPHYAYFVIYSTLNVFAFGSLLLSDQRLALRLKPLAVRSARLIYGRQPG